MNQKVLNVVYGVVLVVLIGAVLYFALGKKAEPINNQPVVINNQPDVSTPAPADLTAGWKTYQNMELGFELKMPTDVSVDKVSNDQNNRLVVFKSDEENFEVILKQGKATSLDQYYYLDFPVSSKSTLGGKEALVFEAANGYCDGPGCGDPFIAYVAKNNDDFYNFVFYGDIRLTDTEKFILASFKFVDTSGSDLTASWKTYADSTVGFTFKYPAEASKNDTQGLVLRVTVNNLDTMEDMPLGYDKATALKDKAALANGDPSINVGGGVKNSFKMLNIDGALAKELTILGILDVCNVQFNRQAIIYKDNSQIRLSWAYAGNSIQENNPSYFKIDSGVCGSEKMWQDMDAFYTDLVAGKTDSVSQNWFTDFNAIIKIFQFTK